MRNINITFEDSEYDKLVESKGDRSWRKFILDECLRQEGEMI